ncbi:MAG TPA: class I SAM-dependent methyltransferase [Puia sp.]|nr:class I SAM-dependent methyltransferase [Puia sp.]
MTGIAKNIFPVSEGILSVCLFVLKVSHHFVNLQDTYQTNNIYIPALARPDRLLEEQYSGSRHRENRSYTDEEVGMLPDIGEGHTHYREWLVRRRSCRRLTRYLTFKKKEVSILEVGCGNGWLSSQLAMVPGSRVVGLDLNFIGLQQAARVFGYQPNLKFMYGDFRSDILQELTFDIIVFASSLQYFPSLRETLERALQQLSPDGEVHILDTRFYRPEELETAHKVTAVYYTSLGMPEMAKHVFHPCSRELEGFSHRYFYNPRSFWNRLFARRKGWPWICVRR